MCHAVCEFAVAMAINLKKGQQWARTLAQYAFCIESRKSWFGELPPLLKNTLQSEILQVNKISIFLFIKKIIIMPARFPSIALCSQIFLNEVCISK